MNFNLTERTKGLLVYSVVLNEMSIRNSNHSVALFRLVEVKVASCLPGVSRGYHVVHNKLNRKVQTKRTSKLLGEPKFHFFDIFPLYFEEIFCRGQWQ